MGMRKFVRLVQTNQIISLKISVNQFYKHNLEYTRSDLVPRVNLVSGDLLTDDQLLNINSSAFFTLKDANHHFLDTHTCMCTYYMVFVQ